MTATVQGAVKIEPVAVTGIWLVRIGDHVVVRAEIDGAWVDVIRERANGNFSHIVEPDGMREAFRRDKLPVP